ncbi:transporter substrate-binding domain-containing protein [Aestuariibacter salexigens]|uniref:transporter substrate-binding domain-containing protein n=1 Tax=Aestuariibacter salexigens TaxID=226010 RepID=UPI0004096C55|nr:transporter substrate-binding domain-containing protein [Aestuariibacter salexigens]
MRKSIIFWNGNKSPTRQQYELDILRLALRSSSAGFADLHIVEDRQDYPEPEQEGAILLNSADVCVTVAGNPKFLPDTYIPIHIPLMKGLLGHRLLIIRDAEQPVFADLSSIEALRGKTAGIPATWADATLFRHNHCLVDEYGQLQDVMNRLADGHCDYVALGANEIHDVFDQLSDYTESLVIESTLRLYYPYALVFYVSPRREELAIAIQQGLQTALLDGAFDKLFHAHNQACLASADLSHRREIALVNPLLPKEIMPSLKEVKSSLLAESVNRF